VQAGHNVNFFGSIGYLLDPTHGAAIWCNDRGKTVVKPNTFTRSRMHDSERNGAYWIT